MAPAVRKYRDRRGIWWRGCWSKRPCHRALWRLRFANTATVAEFGAGGLPAQPAFRLLGQAQMADAFAKFSGTVTTSKLAFVKENKLYRSLKGQKNPARDGFLSGTWDEFCGLLGRGCG